MAKVEDEIKRLKTSYGKHHFDPSLSAKDMGLILDLHNNDFEKKQQKRYEGEINDRNLYFWKLIRAKMAGEEYKSSSFYMGQPSKIIVDK